jgi:hypothetical protein
VKRIIDWINRYGQPLVAALAMLVAPNLLGAESLVLMPFVIGATATYNVSTSATDLKEIWRKEQYGLVVAAQFGVEEWNALMKLNQFKVNWSAREITMELDINDDTNTAMIPEGGKEARPTSPTAVTATITWVFANKRFTISNTAKYIQQQQGNKPQLESQLRWQAKKAIQGVHRKIGDQFWGLSSGTICKVSSVSTDDIVVKDLHGVAALGGTSDDRRCVDLFRGGTDPRGDFIAVVNPSGPALRANGIVHVDTVTRSTNTLTGADVSGITSPAADDLVLFANNLENTTLASGTERNLNLVGIIDMMTTASIHSVSSATYSKWDASTKNTTGGRFTGVKLLTLRDNAANEGGGNIDSIWWSQGVRRDVIAQLQAGLRFNDAYAMELEGEPKAKGITFHTSKRVPDGYVFGWDSKNSVCKMTLLPEPQPGVIAWDDGHKLQDDSGEVFSIDYPCAMVTKNRGNMGYYSAVTES